MFRNLLFSTFAILLLACSNDDLNDNNPNLIDQRVSLQLDLNLPQYNQLNFPGNSFVTYNYGINGIVVFNVNNSVYTAFEMSDPNHPLTDCSTLELNGTEVTCRCDDGNKYNIVTGQQISGEGQYSLKAYRISRVGSVLEISN